MERVAATLVRTDRRPSHQAMGASGMADNNESGGREQGVGRKTPSFAAWSRVFLGELAATSNVSASAKRAEVTTAKVYEARRGNAEFYRLWQVALCEGYEHLEMEVLRRLREGEIKPAAGAKRGVRTFDNANALRLLAAHMASAARQRAIRDDEDTEAVLASLDAKLEKMRQRSLAAKAEAQAQSGATIGDADDH